MHCLVLQAVENNILRIIAGLESADGGQVFYLRGEDATNIHVRERQVGFVFQHYALFRHMTVFDNIAFGLRVRPRCHRPSEAEIKNVSLVIGLGSTWAF